VYNHTASFKQAAKLSIWNSGNIQDVFDTSFRIWKHSARAHEYTAQIEGGRQHLKIFENICNYVVSKEFTNNVDILKSFAACLKTAVMYTIILHLNPT
jgi:hypothetical protein